MFVWFVSVAVVSVRDVAASWPGRGARTNSTSCEGTTKVVLGMSCAFVQKEVLRGHKGEMRKRRAFETHSMVRGPPTQLSRKIEVGKRQVRHLKTCLTDGW